MTVRTGRRRRELPRSPGRQRGIALLVAILLVALGTIIAADIAYRSAMSARRSTATVSFDEAVLVAEAAEALSAYGLKAVLGSGGGGTSGGSNAPNVNAQQPWNTPVGPIEVVPGVTLEAQLEDLQGRFNLNWLVTPSSGNGQPGGTANTPQQPNNGLSNTPTPGAAVAGQPNPQAVAAFRKLLELSNVDPKWADMVVDWIDADNQPQSQGAEDSAYMGQNPPYLAANQYITSTTELLALPGFGRDNYQKIAPFIAALPPSSTLNICTAKGRVLDAFIPAGSSEWEDEAALAKNRAGAPPPGCFPDSKTYSNTFGAQAGTNFNASLFAETSSYFRLSSLVTIGSAEFNLYSLLFLDTQYFVHPIQRSFSPD
jgi:general secretion pathway protein K